MGQPSPPPPSSAPALPLLSWWLPRAQGEGGSSSIIEEMFAPLLLGQDPMNRVGLWEQLFHSLYNGNNAVGLAGSALSAVDIALWDLAGKATGLPVHALLGGSVRDRVAVYATGLYYTEGEMESGRLLEEARGYAEAGYLGMKTKVGGLSIAEDVARVRAIREAIGPQVQLMIDANEACECRSPLSDLSPTI